MEVHSEGTCAGCMGSWRYGSLTSGRSRSLVRNVYSAPWTVVDMHPIMYS